MGLIRYRLRATFRRRLGGYLGLALLIGLVGGVALAAMTAARRTDSSYPDFLASTSPSDLLVQPQGGHYIPGFRTQLARLKHVRSVELGESFNAVRPSLRPAGSPRCWKLRPSCSPARTACSPGRTAW